MTEKELLALKEKIKKSGDALNKLIGEQTAIMRELKQKFDIDTIEGAELLAETISTKINDLETKIENRVQKLEKLIQPNEKD